MMRIYSKTDEGIFIPNAQGSEVFNYTDGQDVERFLIDTLKNSEDLSSSSIELGKKAINWPTYYHLSPRRSNLVRPLQDKLKGTKVLEIGAGCGGVSRFLGETVEELVCLDGSYTRLQINKLRCRELNNVKFVCDNFTSFDSEEKFDFVTLIGVLEYSRVYFDSKEDPILSILRKCKSFLKPSGQLIIAIENKLGLKYFAGFPEDHLGYSMAGIENRYSNNSAVTFGKKELSDLGKSVGFKDSIFYFPFPDYKVPISVFSDNPQLNDFDSNLDYLLSNSVQFEGQRFFAESFDLRRAWREVFKNNLWQELSNSFLVLLCNDTLDNVRNTQPLLWHFSLERSKRFQKQIVFTARGEVIKKAINFSENNHLEDQFHLILKDENLFVGKNWELQLEEILSKEDWKVSDCDSWFQTYLQAIANLLGINVSEIPNLQIIDGKYFDAIPRNLVVSKNEMNFFDLEWVINERIEFRVFLIRSLVNTILTINKIFPSSDTKITNSKRNFLDAIMNRAGLSIDNSHFSSFLNLENDFQRLVNEDPGIMLNEELLGHFSFLQKNFFLDQKRNEGLISALSIQVSDQSLVIKNLEFKSHELEIKKDELEFSLRNVLNSSSWKLGQFLLKPFTKVKSLFSNSQKI